MNVRILHVFPSFPTDSPLDPLGRRKLGKLAPRDEEKEDAGTKAPNLGESSGRFPWGYPLWMAKNEWLIYGNIWLVMGIYGNMWEYMVNTMPSTNG